MSEEIKNLAAAFVAAQAEIGAAIKGSVNPHFKSNYADLAAVIEAIRPAFAKHGLAFIQEVSEREDGIYIVTVIMHKSGEMYRTPPFPMPAPKKDPHGYGSAVTYAKRYSLQATFGVPSEDDDGNKAVEGKQAEQSRTRFPSPVTSSLTGVELDPEVKERMERIANSLVDLHASEDTDVDYKMWELVEPLGNDEKLYLWQLLQPYSAVRSHVKKVSIERAREMDRVTTVERTEPKPEPTGIKSYATRPRTNVIPT